MSSKNCITCGNPTNNPKFCSMSCAAKTTNTNRKLKEYFCKDCGTSTGFGFKSPTKCKKCNFNYVDWSQITIGDLRKKLKLYQLHARLRNHSRSIYRKHNKNKSISCSKCGYTKYTEICHIKPISSFTDDTPVSTVNDISNLIEFCRNCHWEYDHQ